MILTHDEHNVTYLEPNTIFVFGSNLQGIHGKGAALAAREHFGAIWGKSYGIQGQSFAIPTRTRIGKKFHDLPLSEIKIHVDRFINYADKHPDLYFHLTPIGTGLAGYSPSDISSLFDYFPPNVIFPSSFVEKINVR